MTLKRGVSGEGSTRPNISFSSERQRCSQVIKMMNKRNLPSTTQAMVTPSVGILLVVAKKRLVFSDGVGVDTHGALGRSTPFVLVPRRWVPGGHGEPSSGTRQRDRRELGFSEELAPMRTRRRERRAEKKRELSSGAIRVFLLLCQRGRSDVYIAH